MSRPSTSRLKALARGLVGLALFGVVVVALLRVFCLRLFEVTTPSMEPTIHGAHEDFAGERVLVGFGPLFDRAALARFDLVVVQRPGGGAPLCKRLVGLPGDVLQFIEGDLYVDGVHHGAGGVPWVEVFDGRRDVWDDAFHYDKQGPWSWDGGELVFDGSEIGPGAERGMMLLHRELLDTVRGGDGVLQVGRQQVNDARLALDFRLDAPLGLGRARFRLVEDGDRFEVELRGTPEGQTLALVRKPGDEVLAQVPVEVGPGTWWRLVFANRDNRLTATLQPVPEPGGAAPPGPTVSLETTYIANRPYAGVLPDGLSSIAPRVAFGGDGLRARFRDVRIERDLFWPATGEWGARPRIELGPDEYFVVGDNGTNSMDSRHFGPVGGDELVGRPLWVVGPGGNRREL